MQFHIYSSPRETYKAMIKDIMAAKNEILLETYIYNDDKVGELFLRALTKKAKQGVKIKVLLDAWGGTAKKKFFDPLTKAGGEVRFFREFQYFFTAISKNHERNHRKLLLIDKNISYIGSMNIMERCLDWRELIIRLNGAIAIDFVKCFEKSWKIYKDLNIKSINSIIGQDYEIIQDIPKNNNGTEKKLFKLINNAKHKILIETPYFVPSPKLIAALEGAVKRGVRVAILIPWISDVRIVDIARNRFLGILHKKGIIIRYYKKKIIHSKLLIIDNDFFMLGSSNLDYRSFVHNYEINFLGKDKGIIKALNDFFLSGIAESKQFNYLEWKKRSSFIKIMGLLARAFEKYL